MKFSTKAIHIGQEPEALTGAVTVPLYQTSTYAQEEIGKHKGFEYARTQNPTRFAWEANLAAMEGGTHAYAFGSGSAAVDTIMRLLSAGDHVVMAEDMYGGTFRLTSNVLTRFGITFSYVDMRDVKNVEAALLPNTRMIYTETPTNPMMTITDLAAVAEIARANNAYMVVDNTFASPFFQRPLELGAHIVVHSATKYLGGHSDLVSGIVTTNDAEIAEQLKFLQNAVGAVPGPFECWLLLRSSKTLAVRMERHAANAQRIAEYCQQHPSIKATHYPGLSSHPQHEIAKRQMSGFGGMISIELGSLERATAVTNKLKLFTLAESLGGVESLVCHPVSMTHGSIPKDQRERLGVTDGLIRLSCGIEDVEDLLEDLEGAL
ncbi:MAG: cystathionine gamma-synthase [Candidatus Kapabacteria bacterium]|nr:cystathionine gamma-synthase [Ignavibacteria bacterium]MBL0323040.1 cystathionine gamma-synthase [Ignavibacteria bacterium]MBP6509646.1 cystathionine gamma-synthase [Candidatus Kapabacteria bacterium]MBP7094047.1 cystathionine gamma-synthase [Candidatus Kapabacteria bacterium]